MTKKNEERKRNLYLHFKNYNTNRINISNDQNLGSASKKLSKELVQSKRYNSSTHAYDRLYYTAHWDK